MNLLITSIWYLCNLFVCIAIYLVKFWPFCISLLEFLDFKYFYMACQLNLNYIYNWWKIFTLCFVRFDQHFSFCSSSWLLHLSWDQTLTEIVKRYRTDFRMADYLETGTMKDWMMTCRKEHHTNIKMKTKHGISYLQWNRTSCIKML